ncbi:MAG: hypothetical protein ACRC8W_09085 [Plesiomonas shigelloides]
MNKDKWLDKYRGIKKMDEVSKRKSRAESKMRGKGKLGELRGYIPVPILNQGFNVIRKVASSIGKLAEAGVTHKHITPQLIQFFQR